MASASSESVQKPTDQRRKSCDTVCSSNSSCFLQKRKPIHPLAASVARVGVTRSGGSVRQRVLSAKLLRLKTLENQLNDANFHLAELVKENRALKTLQKRQDKALSKYEGEDADLQKILRSYENEVRALQERNKNLRKSVREVNEQLKSKEEELFSVREQLKHLLNLTKDKNLKEREKLQEEVDDLKLKLKNSEDQINVLSRKLMLETKNSKQKLNNEASKSRQLQRRLNEALGEINRLSGSDTRTREQAKRRFANVPQRQAVSMVSLNPKEEPGNETKLEPILVRSQNNQGNSSLESILKSPVESIKARLSSAGNKDVNQMSMSLEKLNLSQSSGSDLPTEETSSTRKSIYTASAQSFRKSSAHKMEKLDALAKAVKAEDEELLGSYYKDVVSSVNECNDIIDSHKAAFEQTKNDTENLIKQLQETDKMNVQLGNSNFIGEKGDELVHEILKEEFLFQQEYKKPSADEILIKTTDRNGNVTKKEPKVTLEDKRKLLETLRAIDNGENVELGAADLTHKKNKLMKELFGNVHD